jgi:hypothetical protein
MSSGIFANEMFPKRFPQRNLLAFLGTTTLAKLSSCGSFNDAVNMQDYNG